jgi:hypothetical protein
MTPQMSGMRSLQARAPATFAIAGLFLLAQVLFIGLRKFGIGSFSELWAAVSGLTAIIASLIGLSGLYPRLSPSSPRLAKAALALIVIAGLLMCVALVLLLSVDRGTSGSMPPAVLGIIGGFLISYVLAFALGAYCSVRSGTYAVAALLSVPAICWGAIVAVGAIAGAGALQLDFYLNAFMAISFLGLGAILRPVD